MTQYNTLNVKLSNLQLNKLNLKIKNGTEVTSKISSNAVGDFNYENSFPHKLFLTNTQILRLYEAFANNSSANIKLLKSKLHRNRQSGGFLDGGVGPVLKAGLSLMKSVFKPLAKSALILLALTASA